jgi:hypothetical protein
MAKNERVCGVSYWLMRNPPKRWKKVKHNHRANESNEDQHVFERNGNLSENKPGKRFILSNLLIQSQVRGGPGSQCVIQISQAGQDPLAAKSWLSSAGLGCIDPLDHWAAQDIQIWCKSSQVNQIQSLHFAMSSMASVGFCFSLFFSFVFLWSFAFHTLWCLLQIPLNAMFDLMIITSLLWLLPSHFQNTLLRNH